MKKYILPIALLTFGAICAWADTDTSAKINPAGTIQLNKYREAVEAQLRHPGMTKAPMQEPVVSAVVLLDKNAGDSVLSGLDVKILSSLNGVVVVSCPITEVEKIAALPEVQSVSFGETFDTCMDYARPAGKVTEVQTGFDADGSMMSFDGTGVVCGMYDIGLQASHINFCNSDGTTRIERLWHMTGSNGTYTEYTPETLNRFTTDTRSEGHATHVAGIMAGGYKGNGTYGKTATASGGRGNVEEGPIPYYGVATNSALAFGAGSLTDANILQGVTNIVQYAQSTGRPVVVNLSLGNVTGPHDGKDTWTQALGRLGESAIICVAAGNDGNLPLAATKTLGSGENAIMRVAPVAVNAQETALDFGYVNGIADVWSSNATPLRFALRFYRSRTSMETLVEFNGPGSYQSSNGDTFSKYFSGAYSLVASVNPNNNRYNIYCTFTGVEPLAAYSTGTLMLEVEGAEGTTVNIFGKSLGFTNTVNGGASISGATNGTTDGTINNMACAENVISVGSYVTRTSWCTLAGGTYTYTSVPPIGSPSNFSSYGVKFPDTQLPMLCAPGQGIVSSFNRFAIASGKTDEMVASVKSGFLTDYWDNMQGTSMACPYVAGTVGLMLQANPQLKYKDVAEILTSTCTAPPAFGLSAKQKGQWGAGKLDALAAVREAIKRGDAGVDDVLADSEGYVIRADGRTFTVTAAGASALTVTLYNLQGAAVATATADANEAVLDATAARPGVYVLSVTAPNAPAVTKKVVVR
ncbi:MAG: S8 family peptidase [Muribaculaceae bacterium]